MKLKSEHGSFDAVVKKGPCRPGHVQGYWPECNVLLAARKYDPVSGEPDYNTSVSIERSSLTRKAVRPAPGSPGFAASAGAPRVLLLEREDEVAVEEPLEIRPLRRYLRGHDAHAGQRSGARRGPFAAPKG